ncbi:MAG: hypothetical protein ABFS08_02790 [Pseudomonadota bacterium]
MLYRSLYFLFHDKRTVHGLINELEEQFALDDSQLHAIIDDNHKLAELPGATIHKKSPAAIRSETTFLYLSMGIFIFALIALVVSLLTAPWYLSALFGLVVIGAQLSGYLLGNRIPNAQLDRFRGRLAEGDILLQVDVPPSRVKTVKTFIAERSPDASTQVSNWHVGTIGL